ncbi:MAG: hypothetical protein HC767_14350 [Akkermansiaceae bacterium]|nr:hypothetical protein [Akkermansiaceae bacterium]
MTDTWINPGPGGVGTQTQVGFVSLTAPGGAQPSIGTSTKDGITLAFAATFSGTAVSSANTIPGQGATLTNATSTNPLGFINGTQNDNNPITFTGTPGFETGFSGAISNYQRWDFSFSEPIILSDFTFEDIDSQGTLEFRDMFGAEAFTTTTPGAAGTGIDPVYTLGSGLFEGTATFAGNDLSAVSAQLNLNNPNNTPEVRASVSFPATPISSFSIYSFSDRVNAHRFSLNSSSFEVTAAIPEPSTALLGVLSLGALFRRRR